MPAQRNREMLQFRVSVGKRSPIYATLAAMPANQRATALVRLAEAGLPGRDTQLVAAVARIAAALEMRGTEVALTPAVPPTALAPAHADRRVARLEDRYGDTP
jgi:hypothetical protein